MVWSTWTEAGKSRQLRRPLLDAERNMLEARKAELEPWVAPFDRSADTKVALALSDMFGGFTSMRQSGEEAAARLDAAMRVLSDFPAWAIEKACRSIQANGVWRDGKFERQWPPSDAEIIKEVRDQVRLYMDVYRSAVSLLTAEVEDEA
jgi:hypothetical protein